MRLSVALRPVNRALIIVGGYGLKWNLSPSDVVKWYHCTSQMIGIANYVGVMATNGRTSLSYTHLTLPTNYSL